MLYNNNTIMRNNLKYFDPLQYTGDDDGSDSDVIVVSPSTTLAHTGSRNCPGAPQRSNPALDSWERSVLATNDAMYLGFRPIVRSRGHEDLTDSTIVEQNPYRKYVT